MTQPPTRSPFQQEVETSLRGASDRKLVQVMQFIDRLPSRIQLEEVVELVRGRLTMVRPARAMTLSRLITLPFEDLLVRPELAAATPRYVPRPAIRVIHRMVMNALPDADRARLDQMCAGRTMDDSETALEVGEELWPAAAEAVRTTVSRALAAGKPIEGMSKGTEACLDTVVTVLERGEIFVSQLCRFPPRPMPPLREEERHWALSFLDHLLTLSPEHFHLGFTMLLRRSTEPMEFFDILQSGDFGLGKNVLDTVMSKGVQECLREIDVMGRDLAAATNRPISVMADAATRMASLIETLENAPSHLRVDSKVLARAKSEAARSVIRSHHASLNGEVHHSFNEVSRPEGGGLAEDDVVERAENVARHTRKLELAGGRMGAAPEMRRALTAEFKSYRDAILTKAREAPLVPAQRLAAVMDEIRLVEIIFGDVAAETLVNELRR